MSKQADKQPLFRKTSITFFAVLKSFGVAIFLSTGILWDRRFIFSEKAQAACFPAHDGKPFSDKEEKFYQKFNTRAFFSISFKESWGDITENPDQHPDGPARHVQHEVSASRGALWAAGSIADGALPVRPDQQADPVAVLPH